MLARGAWLAAAVRGSAWSFYSGHLACSRAAQQRTPFAPQPSNLSVNICPIKFKKTQSHANILACKLPAQPHQLLTLTLSTSQRSQRKDFHRFVYGPNLTGMGYGRIFLCMQTWELQFDPKGAKRSDQSLYTVIIDVDKGNKASLAALRHGGSLQGACNEMQQSPYR